MTTSILLKFECFVAYTDDYSIVELSTLSLVLLPFLGHILRCKSLTVFMLSVMKIENIESIVSKLSSFIAIYFHIDISIYLLIEVYCTKYIFTMLSNM